MLLDKANNKIFLSYTPLVINTLDMPYCWLSCPICMTRKGYPFFSLSYSYSLVLGRGWMPYVDGGISWLQSIVAAWRFWLEAWAHRGPPIPNLPVGGLFINHKQHTSMPTVIAQRIISGEKRLVNDSSIGRWCSCHVTYMPSYSIVLHFKSLDELLIQLRERRMLFAIVDH